MKQQYVMLMDLRKGESLDIGGRFTLRLEEKSGQRARLRLTFKEPTAVRKTQPEAETLPAFVKGMAGA